MLESVGALHLGARDRSGHVTRAHGWGMRALVRRSSCARPALVVRVVALSPRLDASLRPRFDTLVLARV